MAIKQDHVLTFKVESGYDLVPRRKATSDATAYPFAQMNPGQSFEVRGIKTMERVRNAASKFQAEHAGYKFTSRTIGQEPVIDEDTGEPVLDDDGNPVMETVFRIWRIKDLVDNRNNDRR